MSFPLDGKGLKDQGRHHRTSPQPSKCLTLRSRRAFCEGKRQAPLCEGQALSQLLRALPRMSAPPPRPTQSMFGVPTHGKLFFELFLGFAPSAASRHRKDVAELVEVRSNPDIQQAPQSTSSLMVGAGLNRYVIPTLDCAIARDLCLLRPSLTSSFLALSS